MKIGIDIDEVIAETLPEFIRYHNETHGSALKYHDFESYKMDEVLGLEEVEVVKRFGEFFRSPYHKEIRPVDEATRILSELTKSHELIAITARLGPARDATEGWLATHFPGVFSSFHFAWNEYIQAQDGTPPRKGELCNDLGISLFVDDSIRTLMGCVNRGVKGLLFGRPWNRNFPVESMTRISSWTEVPALLSKFEAENGKI